MKSLLIHLLMPFFLVGGIIAYFTWPEWKDEVLPSPPPAPASAKSDAKPVPADDTEVTALPTEASDVSMPARPIEGAPVRHLGEIFQFQVSPDWVIRRWPRVSAGMSHMEMQGYRVPLVTGTQIHDLAGALTYYFNSERRVQRITFQGTTGDYRYLVHLLQGSYGFTARPTALPSVSLYEVPSARNTPKSFLWIESTKIYEDDEIHTRYRLNLVLERPERIARR